PQASAERLALGPGSFRQLFAFLEYSPSPFDDFAPDRGQYDPALGAVDKRCLEDIFQFFYAGAQRRLRDVARLRRPAKVAVIGKQDKMLELAKSRQAHHWLQTRPFSCPPGACARLIPCGSMASSVPSRRQ